MSDLKVTIYGKETIDSLPWPHTPWAKNVYNFILPIIQKGSNHFIENVNATIKALLVDDIVLPLVITERPKNNSYICSPYCHYVTYGKEEIEKMHNLPLRIFCRNAIRLLDKTLSHCQIDKNVFVNNWLVPTNLYPYISKLQLQAITDALIKHFPDHAIVFRSVNKLFPNGLFSFLENLQYSFVLGRTIYYTNIQEKDPFKSRMFKSDLKVFDNTTYEIQDSSEELLQSLPRIRELYNELNIKKYSACNPQFKEAFIELAIKSGWMHFKAFQKGEKIDAIYGSFTNDEVMTSPFFGYDLSKPLETGLYRIISTKLLLEAKEMQKLLHQSSGAGRFKKLRRAKDTPEYSAVYTKHLSSKRIFCWKLLGWVMNKIGKKFMKNMESL